jgi:hypothetical protein
MQHGMQHGLNKQDQTVQNGMTKHAGQWKPGQSGNPDGRPPGSRGKFSEAFYRDLAATWAEHGEQAMRQTATLEPAKFVAICASLIPKDVQVSLSARLPGNLEADDWQIVMAVMEAVRTALPDANQRSPAEVLQFTLDAIRQADAKLIEPVAE